MADALSHDAPVPNAQTHHARASGKGEVLRGFAVGLLATVVLVSGKVALEYTAFGHRLELLAYEFLHRRLSPFDPSRPLPVVVLDTSGIKGGKDGNATSRADLGKLIDALLTTEPRAIAVDMDFSPSRKSGLEGEDDFQFFNELLEKRRRWGVPIFVGVSREAVSAGDPELWLGGREYRELAAFMDINDEDTTWLPYSIKCGEEALYSFGGALTHEAGAVPAALDLFVKGPAKEAERCGGHCSCSYLLANYAKLEIIQAQSLPIITPDAVMNAAGKFRGKVVVLGDGSLERAQDPFVVVGRSQPVSGVFLHAAAVYTLNAEPLYQFTHLGRIVVDFSIALLILSGLAVIHLRNLSNKNFSPHKTESLFIKLVVVSILVGGVLMIRFLHLVWLDFVLIIAALLLHPSVGRRVEGAWTYIKTKHAAAPKAPTT